MKCIDYDECKNANSSCENLGPETSCQHFEPNSEKTEEPQVTSKRLVVPTDNFDKLFWLLNLPLQMWPRDNGSFSVVNYMPRIEQIASLETTVKPDELHQFCENTAIILRNLADRFEMLGKGEIDNIYYPDEGMEQ